MTQPKETTSSDFSGDQRTNIRMSKLARALQTTAAETNWHEMAKMLFRADPHAGRQEKIRMLFLRSEAADPGASYNIEQFQSILILMLIISIAEKRTQDLYQKEFSQRCDEISATYGLNDDQYWKDGKVPEEWEQLNTQFEEQSLQVLLETMREYGQAEIADVVKTDGVEHFFSIIKSVRSQFMRTLGHFDSGSDSSTRLKPGSIPETLQS